MVSAVPGRKWQQTRRPFGEMSAVGQCGRIALLNRRRKEPINYLSELLTPETANPPEVGDAKPRGQTGQPGYQRKGKQ
jgi:hypothetical protein